MNGGRLSKSKLPEADLANDRYCHDREPSSEIEPIAQTSSYLYPALSSPLADALDLEHDGPGVPRQGEESGIGSSQGDTFQNLVPTGLHAEYTWDDGHDCEQERERMKRHYQEYGWLCAPRPGRLLRTRRRKTIRRLGLANYDYERARAIILRVNEVVEEIFKCRVSTTILRATDAMCLTPDQVEVCELDDLVECHFCAMPRDHGCVVARDMERDWRFAKHPRRRARSMIAAPLEFRQGQHGVVIGYLSLFDPGPVDESRHSILCHLADMLVYQLSTRQSHHLEKHSNSMYEACISFLRRGIARARTANRDQHGNELVSTAGLPSPTVTEMAIKRGPREQMSNRVQDIGAEHDLLQDYCSTLRGMLKADVVTIIGLEDFNIYLNSEDGTRSDLVNHVRAFNLGTSFPDHIKPVIHTSHENDRLPLVAYSCPINAPLRLGPHARTTMAEFLGRYLQTQRYWWERTDDPDDIADRVMFLLPESCRTAMSVVYFTPEATPKFVTLVGWNRPSTTFDETSVSSVHFTWVLGGSLRSALAVRRNRWMEHSHLTYANTQAHNLKTPLHHILAITQILRSSITDLAEQQNREQVRDLLPLMDAIDTSGTHLQGIVDNILSFLELKAMERISMSGKTDTYSADQPMTDQALGPMLEDIIAKAYDAEARARKARGESPGRVETILHIASEDLALGVVEDARGLLRAALAKLLANAYKAIADEGCVEIDVDWDNKNATDHQSESRQVRITLSDTGPGMSHAFVQDRLGEPWAKEDPNATGSGLSVYLAYRMVALLHGHMEISSGPGKGCVVQLVAPLSRQQYVQVDETDARMANKVSIVGFSPALEQILRVELARLGTVLVEAKDAQIILADGHLEETREGMHLLASGKPIVYLVFSGHEPLQAITDKQAQLGIEVRRVQKPGTARVIKEALRLDSSLDSEQNLDTPRADRTASTNSIPTIRVGEWSSQRDVGDLIAGLALGQMPEPRKVTTSSNQSTESLVRSISPDATKTTPRVDSTARFVRPDTSPLQSIDEGTGVHIVVVEDNVINRKILVKILKSRKNPEPQLIVVEAEEGEQAVEVFKSLTRPSIVLLDINM